jgi:hypothetical protein
VEFLPEAIASADKANSLSSFAQCVVLVALQGRCVSHRQLLVQFTESLSSASQETHAFWVRHEWLAATIEAHTQQLQRQSDSCGHNDPVLAFTELVARSTVIYLSYAAQSALWDSVDHQLKAIEYEQRACEAAADMARLAKTIDQLSCFKVPCLLPPAVRRGRHLKTETVPCRHTLFYLICWLEQPCF